MSEEDKDLWKLIILKTAERSSEAIEHHLDKANKHFSDLKAAVNKVAELDRQQEFNL